MNPIAWAALWTLIEAGLAALEAIPMAVWMLVLYVGLLGVLPFANRRFWDHVEPRDDDFDGQ